MKWGINGSGALMVNGQIKLDTLKAFCNWVPKILDTIGSQLAMQLNSYKETVLQKTIALCLCIEE